MKVSDEIGSTQDVQRGWDAARTRADEIAKVSWGLIL